MAVIAFTVWDSQTFAAPEGLVAGVPTVVVSSASIANPGAQSSIRVSATYESLSPNNNDGGAGGVSYDLALVVEGQTNTGSWIPIAYQFSGANRTDQAPTREVLMQPDLVTLDAGIDDVVFVGSSELARISRQQGLLPDTSFRVSLYITEFAPAGPNPFTSVTLSVTGERYDVA